MNKVYTYTYALIGTLLVLLVAGSAVWFLFFRTAAPAQTTTSTSFGTSANNTTSTGTNNASTSTNQTISSTQTVTQQKIFEITPGPVVGATLMQTLNPTTTLARYINQEDGHVYDLPLDVPGAIPRVVSDTTIPGGARAVWVLGGTAVILQYLDGNTVKSVYLGFPVVASSSLAAHIHFLPDNIEDIAASPDGKSIVYLLSGGSGVSGYIANADGTGSKKVFSLPLSQVLISWPSQGTLLAQSKSAVGVPGIAFSVDVKSGAATPLLYTAGLTAIANITFTYVVYQTVQAGALTASSFVHAMQSGVDTSLAFDPLPEKCIWSPLSTTLLLCAAPLQYVSADYLDLWHQGLASAADSLIAYNISTGQSSLLATPGSADGGAQSDILQMAVSPDEHYLIYTTKGDRSLWGVRLGSAR